MCTEGVFLRQAFPAAPFWLSKWADAFVFGTAWAGLRASHTIDHHVSLLSGAELLCGSRAEGAVYLQVQGYLRHGMLRLAEQQKMCICFPFLTCLYMFTHV